MRIKKGDTVVVIAGKDKNKTGKVLIALPKEQKLVIQGVNVVTKRSKRTPNNPNPEPTLKELPIHVSNVAYFDQQLNKPTKIAYQVSTDQNNNKYKVRIAKKSGIEIK